MEPSELFLAVAVTGIAGPDRDWHFHPFGIDLTVVPAWSLASRCREPAGTRQQARPLKRQQAT